MKTIKFVKGWESYIIGDTAVFEDGQADDLVCQGFAEMREAGTKEEEEDNEEWKKRLPPIPKNVNCICAICGQIFKTIQLLCRHKEKKHGIK